jgi:hypothetical protein
MMEAGRWRPGGGGAVEAWWWGGGGLVAAAGPKAAVTLGADVQAGAVEIEVLTWRLRRWRAGQWLVGIREQRRQACVARVGSGVGHTWHGSGSESSVSKGRSRGARGGFFSLSLVLRSAALANGSYSNFLWLALAGENCFIFISFSSVRRKLF